jgi:hypothetical protein
MLKWLARRRIAAFERAFDYDMSYARDILAADLGAFLGFGKLMRIAQYRKDLPPIASYAAKLAATLAEDCGPCTQLLITMAEREGIAPEVLSAILAGDPGAMPDDAALAFRFARAMLAHEPGADALRQEVVWRWGRRGLVSLSFAIVAGRLFPTVKYALGHGQACARVTVGGAPMPVLRDAA